MYNTKYTLNVSKKKVMQWSVIWRRNQSYTTNVCLFVSVCMCLFLFVFVFVCFVCL